MKNFIMMNMDWILPGDFCSVFEIINVFFIFYFFCYNGKLQWLFFCLFFDVKTILTSWVKFQWSLSIFLSIFCWILPVKICKGFFWDYISEGNWSIIFLSYNVLVRLYYWIYSDSKYCWEMHSPLQRRPCRPYVANFLTTRKCSPWCKRSEAWWNNVAQ